MYFKLSAGVTPEDRSSCYCTRVLMVIKALFCCRYGYLGSHEHAGKHQYASISRLYIDVSLRISLSLHAQASISKINIRERDIYIRTPILSLIFPKGRLKNNVFILFCIFRKDSPCTILSPIFAEDTQRSIQLKGIFPKSSNPITKRVLFG